MDEKGTVEEELILGRLQVIGIAQRALKSKLDLRRENRDREARDLLDRIGDEVAAIEIICNEHPVLTSYRDGYAEALRWVLANIEIETDEIDRIKKVLG